MALDTGLGLMLRINCLALWVVDWLVIHTKLGKATRCQSWLTLAVDAFSHRFPTNHHSRLVVVEPLSHIVKLLTHRLSNFHLLLHEVASNNGSRFPQVVFRLNFVLSALIEDYSEIASILEIWLLWLLFRHLRNIVAHLAEAIILHRSALILRCHLLQTHLGDHFLFHLVEMRSLFLL